MKSTDYKSDPDYKNLVDLLAVLSEAHTRQTALQAQLNHEYLETIDEHRAEYAANQSIIAETEASIVVLARRHPEWFPQKKKTVSTPYGSVKSVSGSKLVVASPEASIALIKQAGSATEYIRQREELDLEALEKLEDDTLALFGIRREATETITPKPLAIDLGKAVADAEEKEEAA